MIRWPWSREQERIRHISAAWHSPECRRYFENDTGFKSYDGLPGFRRYREYLRAFNAWCDERYKLT